MTLIIKNSGIRNCDCAIYPSTLLVKLLFIALMTISTASLAQTAIEAETVTTPVVTTDMVEAITPADAGTTSISVENNNAIRQDLARIITSEDYANSEQITSWEPIEKPDKSEADLDWLENFLESIFGASNDTESSVALFSMLLKFLLVAALIAFIVWVMRRAGYLVGWAERINKHTGRRSSSHLHQQAGYQDQGWEHLPSHEQIPDLVKQYLIEGKITQAASVLYRGSLRWLVVSEHLPIAAANTEQQCLAQIQQLAQFEYSKPHVFISQIIRLWVQTAYDEQQLAQYSEQLSQQLQSGADLWLSNLPSIAAINADANDNANDNSQQGAS